MIKKIDEIAKKPSVNGSESFGGLNCTSTLGSSFCVVQSSERDARVNGVANLHGAN